MSRTRTEVSLAFLFFGTVAGSLLPRLPALKENLHLSDGQVGLAFLAFAIGAVVGAGAGRVLLARGARSPVRVAILGLCATLWAPAVAPSFVWLVLAFLAGGLVTGALDLLVNAQAAEVERDAGRPMINRFHGFWSLGAIVGSVIAAGAAAAHFSPAIHFGAVALLTGAASLPLLAGLPDTRGGAAGLLPADATRVRIGTAMTVVALLAFLGIVAESAGNDWSAVYLHDVGRATQEVAALGFAALALAMTTVRFFADRLTAKLGAARAAGLGAAVSAFGFALAIAFPMPVIAIVGFALVGAGSSVLVPLAFSASANLDAAGNALGVVTAAGYAGSLVGPPLIGAVADQLGLRVALGIAVISGIAVVVMMATTRVLSVNIPRRSANATEGVESKA